MSIPGQEAKIPHDSWPKLQNIKQEQYCDKKSNEDFKNGPCKANVKQRKKMKEQIKKSKVIVGIIFL